MKQKTVNLIITLVSVLLMCVLTAAAVLYVEGAFDTAPDTTEAATEPETAPATTEAPETAAPITDPVQTTAEGFTPSDHDTLVSAYGVMDGGFRATEDIYDAATMKLRRLTSLALPDSDSEDDFKTVKEYIVNYNGAERSFAAVMMMKNRRAVEVYMGMIVVSDQGKLSFYNGQGELLCGYSGEEELFFVYGRDLEDRPLFMIGDDYYYIDEDEKEFKKSDYDDRDNRGMYFNYPSYFGKSEGQFTVFRSGNMYGIKKTDGKNLRNAIFQEAYNFSEGLGLVIYKDDVCYLNENGRVVIENKVKTELLTLVGCRDASGIGALYFDGGYVRMRKIYYDIHNNVIEDSDILIDKTGAVFPMPTGYKFESYSNQRILLSKNGYYGFYATKGAWIADTVYTYATPYYEGLAVVGYKNGKKGVIDLDGNFVIPLSYSDISVCSGGVIVCYYADLGYDIYVKSIPSQSE